MIFTSEVADIVMVGRMFLAEHEIGTSIYRYFCWPLMSQRLREAYYGEELEA